LIRVSGCGIAGLRIQISIPRQNSDLACLVKLGQGNSGYKIIEEFLPEAAA
jgi:hypothetical protein